MNIAISQIFPNPEQPRKEFDLSELEALAETIREHGVIQPVTVEQCGSDYILHDGERRWRAAKMAGLLEIPAHVTAETNEKERLERAVVANVQRKNMNPVEEAQAYSRMRTEFKMSTADIARRLGVSTVTINNRLLIMKLDPEIWPLIASGALSHYHEAITALLTLPKNETTVKFAKQLAARRASVRIIKMSCKYQLEQQQAAAIVIQKIKQPEPSFPAMKLAVERAEPKKDLPEWDALYQLKCVPAWPVIVDVTKKTCDGCAMREVASSAICSECPMVEMLRNLMETANVN